MFVGFLDFLAYLDASPVLSQKEIHKPRTCHLHVIWICSWLSFRIFLYDKMGRFSATHAKIFSCLDHYLFGFFSCLFRAMSQRFEMCERTKRIASTPQLNLPAWFLIPIIVIISQTKRPDQAVVPLLSSPLWLREYLFMNAYWLPLICAHPPLLPTERYHTLLRLYRSTRPNTVSCCPAWCPPKLSCVAATWSSCKPSSKLPGRSRKPAKRPSQTCAGTAPPLTSPSTLQSIDQTSTEVLFWDIMSNSI